VVKKILCCVPPRLKQITLAISTLLDVLPLTIANLADWLKAMEEVFEESSSTMQHEGKLYLTEDEWDVRIWCEAKNPGVDGSSHSDVSSDHGRGCGNHRHGKWWSHASK
jgi:hypothetical protein